MKPVRTTMLVKTKVSDNNNKFYEINLYADGKVVGRNGRVGTDGVLQDKGFIGESGYEKLVNEKLKKGYKRVELATVSNGGANTSVVEVAKRDIAGNNPDLCSLIERLATVNRFQLLDATGGQIDIVDGVVKTAVGPVTLNTVESAKNKLSELENYITKKEFGSAYINILEDYLTLVPQKVPHRRGWEIEFFSGFSSLQKQWDILEQLENSIKSYRPQTETLEERKIERIFGYSLEPVKDDGIFAKLQSFYKNGISGKHVTSNYKLIKIYRLVNDEKASRYEVVAKRLGNRKMLWHGTRAHNVLSILKGGLIVPPTNGNFTITGRMFGDGIYFSDQSTKSLNYSAGYWVGQKENGSIFMLNAEVAMGKEYVPSGPIKKIPVGYDSIYAIGGRSGVINNEMIVPTPEQVRLDYLCEFEPT